ncbi:MAG: hypothetical protein AB8G77_05860 [Rhodothermales bacterium]
MQNLNTQSRNIAVALLSVFLWGSLVVPGVHEIAHFLELSHDDHATHIHPDYEALLDANQHRLDTHIDCIQCNNQSTSFRSTTRHGLLYPWIYQAFVYHSDVWIVERPYGVLTVRGPPLT